MKHHYLSHAPALALALIAVSTAAAQAPAFTAIDYPGATSTSIWGINSHGDMVGLYALAGVNHGFLFKDGRFTSIDFPGATSTGTFGINNKGDIAGDYMAGGVLHGFVMIDGHFTNIDLPGGGTTDPAAITLRGDVTGIYTAPDKSAHAFLLSSNHVTLLDFPKATATTGNSLNSVDDVVGNYTLSGVTHGFLRSGGKFSPIDFPNAAFTGAYGIDSRGNIVGRYRDAAGVTHGYLLSGGKYTSIDVPGATLTSLAAINSSGDMVGRYVIAGVNHGVLIPGPRVSYTVTDLGTLPGGTFSQPSIIADNGLVAGVADVASGAQHSVLWQFGKIIDIGTVGLGGRNNGVYGINAAGQANGIAETTLNDPNGEDFCGYGTHVKCLPFRWQNGVMTPLTLLGGNNGTVGNINQRGEIVGVAETNTQDKACPAPQLLDYQAVVWGPAPGQIRQLGPLPGDTVGVALWINDRGQAVGASGTCANTMLPPLAMGPHAVLWEADGTPVNLGNLGGTGNPHLPTGNMALGVNNAGEVVGASVLVGNAITHAFFWTRETGMRDLGTLPGDVNSAALAVNDRGQVIGISFGAHGPFDGSGRPFLWQNGLMTDLTTLVPADSPLEVLYAAGINSRGEIAGFGATVHGDMHALVLTPNDSLSTGADERTLESIRPATRRPLTFGRFGTHAAGPQ